MNNALKKQKDFSTRIWKARRPLIRRYFASDAWPETCWHLGLAVFVVLFGTLTAYSRSIMDPRTLSFGAVIWLCVLFGIGIFCMVVMLLRPDVKNEKICAH